MENRVQHEENRKGGKCFSAKRKKQCPAAINVLLGLVSAMARPKHGKNTTSMRHRKKLPEEKDNHNDIINANQTHRHTQVRTQMYPTLEWLYFSSISDSPTPPESTGGKLRIPTRAAHVATLFANLPSRSFWDTENAEAKQKSCTPIIPKIATKLSLCWNTGKGGKNFFPMAVYLRFNDALGLGGVFFPIRSSRTRVVVSHKVQLWRQNL